MKTLTRITVVLTIMSFIAFQGFSQNTSTARSKKDSQNAQTKTNTAPGKFIDNNNDGVCDNYQTRMNNRHGANFVDKNGDGICDNRQSAAQRKGNPNGCGMGYQHRHGQGKGNCFGSGCRNQNRHGRGN